VGKRSSSFKSEIIKGKSSRRLVLSSERKGGDMRDLLAVVILILGEGKKGGLTGT